MTDAGAWRRGPAGARIGVAIALAALHLAGATPAAAQAPSEIDARITGKALYDEGVRLMDAGRVAEACPKFELATRVDPGRIGVMLKLAACYEAEGRVASAKTGYDLAEAAAQKAGDARAVEAHTKAVALAPRVPRLTITVLPVTAGPGALRVQRDEIAVESALWGVPVPVDPGEHTITASAAGKKPWREVVKLGERDVKTIEVPALADEAPAALPPPAAPLVPAPSAAATSVWSTPRVVGVAVGAVGVAGLVAGAVLGGIAIQKLKDSNAGGNCAGNLCNQQGLDLRGDAISTGNASTALFAVGGALAATGIVLVAVAPRKVAASAALGPSGLTLRGSW
jgi:hypothetical protein